LVLKTIKMVADRVQVAMVVGSFPSDGSGEIRVLHANQPAAHLFGFGSPTHMAGVNIRSLMPSDVSKDHTRIVQDYLGRSPSEAIRSSSIMGRWRSLDAHKQDGTKFPVAANVADIQSNGERYFVAVFMDRTNEVQREERLKAALGEAETARLEAEAARKSAEDGLLKQKKLSAQVTLLRQLFQGTIGLVVMLGIMVVASWFTGTTDKEALSMIERILLVLTGILGSAVASVFDSRNGANPE
jgi:PAS domain S-box-containing protein